MARDPLVADYPVKRRMLELGVVRDDDRADRLLELMRDDAYIEFGVSRTARAHGRCSSTFGLLPKP
ncbi:MAG: hypothetical protein ACRDLA_18150 [Thermoleophilaceae bacterium]